MNDELQAEGRVWMRNAVSPAELAQFDALSSTQGRPGARGAFDDDLGRAVCNADFVARIQNLWPGMRPVRLVSFGKNTGSNWSVPWHQDRIITVKHRTDLPGYTNWSRKQGVWHCEPPDRVLDDMLFVRVHLDANTAQNGAMEIARRSHLAGKTRTERAGLVAKGYETEITTANPGDVLIMKMLTLHRSLPSQSDEPRRVLRVDFSAASLANPLEWAS